MKFKPFSDDFNFSEDSFVENYPDYLQKPIQAWVITVLYRNGLTFNHYTYAIGNDSPTAIKSETLNQWRAIFHRDFPQHFDDFFVFLFQEPSLVTNFLSFVLQNFCNSSEAAKLESFLANANSAYRVISEDGTYELQKRVSDVVKEQSKNAIKASELIKNAWRNCYKPEPDYERAVRYSVDFIEGYFRDRYFPELKKTKTVYKLLEYFQKHPEELKYRGSTFMQRPELLLELLEGVSDIRGEHTTGSGRPPTKNEAEYILHTVIYLWNLMQG